MENLIEELTKVNPSNLSEEGLKLFNKINEIIDRNRELEESEKYLYDAYQDVGKKMFEYSEQLENSIPKSLIKEKIEEYDKQRIKMEKDDIGVGFTLGKEWSDLKAKIQVLEELITPLKNV